MITEQHRDTDAKHCGGKEQEENVHIAQTMWTSYTLQIYT